MTSKAAPTSDDTAKASLTTSEELPVLSATESAALRQSLVDAEDRIKSGDFVEYVPRMFDDRLRRTYRKARYVKKA